MEKLTAGQCSEFVNAALSRSSSPEVVLLAYVADSLIQEVTEMAGIITENMQTTSALAGQYDKLSQRYAELQYLAKARNKDD